MKTILQQKKYILKKKKEWTDKLYALQASCPHSGHLFKYRSNTGNYSPSDDSYWTEHTCDDCGKYWTEERN